MPCRIDVRLRAGVEVNDGLDGLRLMSGVLERLVGADLVRLPLCSVVLWPINLIMDLYSSRVSPTVLLTCMSAECVFDWLKVSLGKTENDLAEK